MKKYITVMIFLLGILSAQEMRIGFGGGFNIPMGDLSDAAGFGFKFGGDFGYKFIPQLGILGLIDYNIFTEKTISVPVYDTVIDLKSSFNNFSLGGMLTVYPPLQNPNLSIYFGGGLGFNMQTAKVSYLGYSESDSETDLGLVLGGGFIIKNNFELSFLYNHIFWDEGSGQYLSFGFKYLLKI
ncbi:MAG: outer membrane beta-barrel protein [candidate division WOR-3 bacterium]